MCVLDLSFRDNRFGHPAPGTPLQLSVWKGVLFRAIARSRTALSSLSGSLVRLLLVGALKAWSCVASASALLLGRVLCVLGLLEVLGLLWLCPLLLRVLCLLGLLEVFGLLLVAVLCAIFLPSHDVPEGIVRLFVPGCSRQLAWWVTLLDLGLSLLPLSQEGQHALNPLGVTGRSDAVGRKRFESPASQPQTHYD